MKKLILFFLCCSVSVNLMADTKRIYCKMTQSWWTADNAAVAAHTWGSGTGTTWPGKRMTRVSGETGMWYIDLDLAQVQNIIFVRVNPSGTITDWNAKTQDLTIPTDSKNLFTITSSSAVWGDPGCVGSWSNYTPNPETPNFYITGDSALVVDAGLNKSKAWNPDAISSFKDTFILNLKAGVDYKLKITLDGTWDTPLGYTDLTESVSGLAQVDGNDNNIGFRLKTAGQVKVIYSADVFKLVGSFALPCSEAYGLLIDGVFHACKRNLLQPEWTEFMLRDVKLNKNQTIQLYDSCNAAAWVINNYAETSYKFSISDNKYVVSEDGTYDFYIKFIFEADELYVAKHGVYSTAVPSQCTDVLMQAFYNESYQANKPEYGTDIYGDTKWATLLPQAAEIGQYIDLVWLPPSAYGDGMGYHPKNYSDQNSAWGTRAELEALITALHKAGAKVVADIVINHCAGWTTWCDFPEFDFGEYGTFHPDESYIACTDEVNLNPDAGECYQKATGPQDDGWGDWYGNWDGARDWAHDAPKVQEMFKAYLKWMRNVMKYDGFRYDKGDGFNNWHHDNYNKASGPYIAFMELWSGNDQIIAGIEQANKNMMALDFQTKYSAFDGIAGFDYSKCKGSGLLGRGYAKNAVTFIDSHDWFLRNNGQEFGGNGKSMTDELKDRLLQANAFMLGMPGVPCIFYPHWKKYKEALKPMIEARKLAGVHSESHVSDEYAEQGGYQCTLEGKYGWMILQLGNKTTHTNTGDFSWLNDYQLIASGPGYAMWVNRTAPLPTGIDDIDSSSIQEDVRQTRKFIQNGQLFIEHNNHLYNALGIEIK